VRRPRALRTRLLLAIVLGVGVVLAGVILAFNLVLANELSNEAAQVVRARAAAERDTIAIRDGRMVMLRASEDADLQTRAWVFQGDEVLQAPRVDPVMDVAAARLAAVGEGSVDVPGRETRLYAVPVMDGGERIGAVVAGISLAPYGRVVDRSIIGSVALGLAVLAAVTVAAMLMLRAALRPVSRMTRDAATWSDRDLDMRFALGPAHDEITELAATLDGLLDRLAAGLRRERHLTAEISHELRTPLAQIRAEVDLALRRPRGGEEYRAALTAIGEGVERLETTIETLLVTARHEGGLPRGTADVGEAAARVASACAGLADDHGVDVTVQSTGGRLLAGVDGDVIERILQPVVENGCMHAATRVTIAAAAVHGIVEVRVTDDGAGVDAADLDAIFEPGRRGPDDATHTGAGLGLALARRLARAAGGDVHADAGPGGRFTIQLPTA